MIPPWIIPRPRKELRGEANTSHLTPPGEIKYGPRPEFARTVMEGGTGGVGTDTNDTVFKAIPGPLICVASPVLPTTSYHIHFTGEETQTQGG